MANEDDKLLGNQLCSHMDLLNQSDTLGFPMLYAVFSVFFKTGRGYEARQRQATFHTIYSS